MRVMLDTGSAAHLVNHRDMLDPGSITKCNVEIVGIGGDKGAMSVEEKGSITMKMGGKVFTLQDVLLAHGAHILTSHNGEA